MTDILLRLETESDHAGVESLTREAFWDIYQPGCSEHLLAHKLRKSPAFVPELDFVAELDGRVVGNIMYTRAKVVGADGTAREVLIFGPVSVLPQQQKKGTGAALIRHTLTLAAELGFAGVVIFGHPAYYKRFGFADAKEFGITTEQGANFPEFMALELRPRALAGAAGKFYADPVYQVDDAELEVFDRNFPPKEKHVTATQLKGTH